MTAVVFMILELQPRYYNVSDMSMRSPADCGVIAANCYNYNYKQPSISVSISGPELSTTFPVCNRMQHFKQYSFLPYILRQDSK